MSEYRQVGSRTLRDLNDENARQHAPVKDFGPGLHELATIGLSMATGEVVHKVLIHSALVPVFKAAQLLVEKLLERRKVIKVTKNNPEAQALEREIKAKQEELEKVKRGILAEIKAEEDARNYLQQLQKKAPPEEQQKVFYFR